MRGCHNIVRCLKHRLYCHRCTPFSLLPSVTWFCPDHGVSERLAFALILCVGGGQWWQYLHTERYLHIGIATNILFDRLKRLVEVQMILRKDDVATCNIIQMSAVTFSRHEIAARRR